MDLEVADGWRLQAACRGMPSDMFVSSDMTRAQELAAKRVCAGCDVVAHCLSYAMVYSVGPGIWGGLTPDERRPMRRRWLENRESVTSDSFEKAHYEKAV